MTVTMMMDTSEKLQ